MAAAAALLAQTGAPVAGVVALEVFRQAETRPAERAVLPALLAALLAGRALWLALTRTVVGMVGAVPGLALQGRRRLSVLMGMVAAAAGAAAVAIPAQRRPAPLA